MKCIIHFFTWQSKGIGNYRINNFANDNIQFFIQHPVFGTSFFATLYRLIEAHKGARLCQDPKNETPNIPKIIRAQFFIVLIIQISNLNASYALSPYFVTTEIQPSRYKFLRAAPIRPPRYAKSVSHTNARPSYTTRQQHSSGH